MNWIIASMHAHPAAWTLGAYFLFSNAISAMPTPGSSSGGFYRWLFDFSHLLAGNISRIVATRYPQAQALQAPVTPTPANPPAGNP